MIGALLAEVVAEIFISKAFTSSYQKIKELVTEKKSTIITSKEDMKSAIKQHILYVNQWSSEVSFKEMKSSKITEDIFIKLKIYSEEKRRSYINPEKEDLDYKTLFKYPQNRNAVIIGLPGAGKTTLMKHLCQAQLSNKRYFSGREFLFPLIIRLKELNKRRESSLQKTEYERISERIAKSLGIYIVYGGDVKDGEMNWILDQVVYSVLEELQLLIILDGLDEITEYDARDNIAKEINDLGLNTKKSRIILTTRSGEFYYNLESFNSYEIAALESGQIKEFAERWFSNLQDSIFFLEKIKNSPYYDTTLRPLNLAHLCAIFERSRTIPDQPKSIYRLIVELSIKEWDQQRFIVRKSRYSNFEIDKKLEFLSQLAYELTVNFKSWSFERSSLEQIYGKICSKFDLPSYEVTEVVDELESHNGLFIKSGADRYEFTHKSLQEYLTADFIVRLPVPISDIDIIYQLPHELAIAVAISSDSTMYFYEAIMQKIGPLRKKLNFHFLNIFIERLIVEKPIFSSNAILSLCILSFFTKYINYSKKIDGYVVDTFNKLGRIPKVKESIEELFAYYRLIEIPIEKRIGLHTTVIIYQIVKRKGVTEVVLKNARKSLFIPISYTLLK